MTDIPGWFSPADANAIEQIASRLPTSGVLVELGSLFGRSASAWADAFERMNKKYTIYCVDTYCCTPFEISRIHQYIHTMDGDVSLIADFLAGKESHFDAASRFLSKITNVTMVNHDIYEELPFLDSIDCVFEDAFHTFDKYNIAINKWYPRLNENGIFCGHDYNLDMPLFSGLCSAIKSFSENNKLELQTYPNSVVYSYATQPHS